MAKPGRFGINYFSAARKGDWKLVYSLHTGTGELYNLKEDIGETKNLASIYPEKLKSLEVQLGLKLKNWKSPMPFDKTTHQPVPWPGE